MAFLITVQIIMCKKTSLPKGLGYRIIAPCHLAVWYEDINKMLVVANNPCGFNITPNLILCSYYVTSREQLKIKCCKVIKK